MKALSHLAHSILPFIHSPSSLPLLLSLLRVLPSFHRSIVRSWRERDDALFSDLAPSHFTHSRPTRPHRTLKPHWPHRPRRVALGVSSAPAHSKRSLHAPHPLVVVTILHDCAHEGVNQPLRSQWSHTSREGRSRRAEPSQTTPAHSSGLSEPSRSLS